jgi:membrane peptidoglycan carboxypeptidase
LTPPVARHSQQTPPRFGRRARTAPKARRGRRRWGRIVLLTALGGFLGLLALLGAGYARTDIPAANADATAGATRILYSDGSELGRVGGQNRIPVELDEVPEDVQEAILAAEDRNFYSEPGISPRGIARALLTNVRGGGDIQQGGSTITQQYAKNAFLTSERTYTRKVKEVFLALKMTRERTKESILEDYLNTIYFGRGASGIAVASQNYFGKPVSALTPGEGAVLAATIRSPANYDPSKHPERARERWQYVVDAMVERGWVEPEAVQAYPEVLPPGAGGTQNNDMSGPKGHVISKVMEELSTIGIDEALLARGGLEVKTTLRRPAQEAAVAAMQARVGDGSDAEGLQGALVSVEPGTGAIVAYYGGGTGTGFDYASQGGGNQPGSSFKPYVLAAALEEGIGLRSRFDGNSPKDFPGGVEINNYDDDDYGQVDLIEATRKSINTAYYELGLEVGPEKVKEVARRAGVSEEAPLTGAEGETNGGIALGAYEVSVVDQAVGFATFAANGVAAEPYMIDRVLRDGEPLYVSHPEVERAFEEDVAADVTAALEAVVRAGTGTKAQLAGGRPTAGKTGTSSDNRDAWFVGYTPQLATAVWLGYGGNRPIKIDGVEVTGGGFSTTIWKSYMDAASSGMPEEDFPEPANVGKARNRAPETSTSRPKRTREPSPEPPSPSPTEAAEPEPTGPSPKPSSASPKPSSSPQPSSTPPPPPSPPPPPGPEPSPSGTGIGGTGG